MQTSLIFVTIISHSELNNFSESNAVCHTTEAESQLNPCGPGPEGAVVCWSTGPLVSVFPRWQDTETRYGVTAASEAGRQDLGSRITAAMIRS